MKRTLLAIVALVSLASAQDRTEPQIVYDKFSDQTTVLSENMILSDKHAGWGLSCYLLSVFNGKQIKRPSTVGLFFIYYGASAFRDSPAVDFVLDHDKHIHLGNVLGYSARNGEGHYVYEYTWVPISPDQLQELTEASLVEGRAGQKTFNFTDADREKIKRFLRAVSP